MHVQIRPDKLHRPLRGTGLGPRSTAALSGGSSHTLRTKNFLTLAANSPQSPNSVEAQHLFFLVIWNRQINSQFKVEN